jgi:hypothetical protein
MKKQRLEEALSLNKPLATAYYNEERPAAILGSTWEVSVRDNHSCRVW